MFRRVPGTYWVSGRGSGHPRQKIWALWAKRGNTPATRGWCGPHMGQPRWTRKGEEGKERKGIGFPLPFLLRWKKEGGRHLGKPQVGSGSYLGCPLAASPPLPPLFLSFLIQWFSPYGGRSSPCWLLRFPSWPIRPISFARGARNPFR